MHLAVNNNIILRVKLQLDLSQDTIELCNDQDIRLYSHINPHPFNGSTTNSYQSIVMQVLVKNNKLSEDTFWDGIFVNMNIYVYC